MTEYAGYMFITESTAAAARDRTYSALDHLTGGNVKEAIDLVKEYTELSSIVDEIKANRQLDEAREV